MSVTDLGDVPPVYRIDLSLPPSERYVELARVYHDQLWLLTGLFDDLVLAFFPQKSLSWIKRASRLLLRKLYTDEETEEIKGISRVTGIKLYLLVAFNVLLDLLMGCTSGGALAQPASGEARMLHFRTLDWAMDNLRQLVVQLEFVRSPEDEVLATSITYVGYVGVLTGVRRGLSLSLNFRPYHNETGTLDNYRFYANHLLVLLGVRRSVSSLLRQYLIPPPPPRTPKTGLFTRLFKSTKSCPCSSVASLDYISATLPRVPTTAAYLIFSDGSKTLVVEKDHRTAVAASSTSFIVATNSDLKTFSPGYVIPESTRQSFALAGEGAIGMNDLILDSRERQALMQGFWDKKVMEKQKSQVPRRSDFRRANLARRNPPRKARPGASSSSEAQDSTAGCSRAPSSYELQPWGCSSADGSARVTASLPEIVEWTSTYPITNEMTHFTVVMDALEGDVVWIGRYMFPLQWVGSDDHDEHDNNAGRPQ